ncbi:Outer membrane lipoprotein BfpB (plasmid) [Janthinobacterium sp. HH102]|nr:Outer membrane lipoprotein BfpB [Janthinobacterium sp. HH102]
MKNYIFSLVIIAISGCANVSQEMVDNRAREMSETISDKIKERDNKVSEPLVKHYDVPYLGSATIPLAYDATLPAVFRDVTLNFNGRTNLTTIGERIFAATGIPVRLRPDIFIPMATLVSGGISSKEQNAQALPGSIPKQNFMMPSFSNADTLSSKKFDDYDTDLPMDYSGSLSGYLDNITARLGINWEYKEGTITLFRLVTRILPVKLSPGSSSSGSTLSKASSGGASSGGGASGSISSNSTSTMKHEFSIWKSIDLAVKNMLTPAGTHSIDEAGGFVIVKDSKEVTDLVAEYIAIQNSALNKQVDLSVRILKVSINDTSSFGADANAIYTKIANGASDWSLGMTAPSTLASTSAGKLAFSILKPDSPFKSSTVLLNTLNQIGTVVSDVTRSATTMNREQVALSQFKTISYLAETKPSSGGSTGGGAGVPGLTPGSVTTGFFLNALPTAMENDSVLLKLSIDDSSLTRMNSITTGSGETLQQIQNPEIEGYKSDHSSSLRNGESMIIMGGLSDGINGDKRTSVTGFSTANQRSREMQIIIVTPKVHAGM